MLADPDSSIIRRFGLFNEETDPASRDYGVPHPSVLLVDPQRIVRQKVAEEHYIHRLPVRTLLIRLGRADPPGAPQQARHLDGYLEVHTAASEETLYPGNVFTLFVDVHPRPGVHVYAPGRHDYQGMDVALEPLRYLTVRSVQYAPAETLTLPILGETLPVYSRPVRVSIDAALGNRFELQPVYQAGGVLEVRGQIRVQACDDRVCWPPEAVALTWRFPLRPPDLERAPEALQHRAKR